MFDDLPPPIDAEPKLQPVPPPEGSPDYARRHGAPVEPEAVQSAPVVEPPPVVAALDFVAGRSHVIALDYPFRLDDKLIEAIEVKRLSMRAVSDLVATDRHRDLYEIYAEMTGLPAAVVRGLDADDGDRVMEAGWRFLPRVIRPLFEGSP